MYFCSDLNENGPYKPIGSVTLRRFGLVGIIMPLLVEVCHWSWTLRPQILKSDLVLYFLLAAFQSGCRTVSFFRIMSPCMSP